MVVFSWYKEKILILVKAYPERSTKYGSAICMAGITEEYKWVRLYPIEFDYFKKKLKFKKFEWIEAEIKRANEKLMRKESYKVRQHTIKSVDDSLASIKGSKSIRENIWKRRIDIIKNIQDESVYQLREKWSNDKTSLGLIKPNLIDFRFRKPIEKIKIEKEKLIQKSINGEKKYISDKIEHFISYKFKCNDSKCMCSKKGKFHDMTCEDWELFEAIRKWQYPAKEKEEKIQDRFFNWMKSRDFYFCLGMISTYPTWVIIGLLYPPQF
ncbi:hypothetical protein LCGC14_1804850 [marine sediment metagenome]|uniref:Uncharacterized protein n=1 Tax=marine sediment metagenome TaxID=412755 RepID=A0A0F9J3A5_9ZZZZ